MGMSMPSLSLAAFRALLFTIMTAAWSRRSCLMGHTNAQTVSRRCSRIMSSKTDMVVPLSVFASQMPAGQWAKVTTRAKWRDSSALHPLGICYAIACRAVDVTSWCPCPVLIVLRRSPTIWRTCAVSGRAMSCGGTNSV